MLAATSSVQLPTKPSSPTTLAATSSVRLPTKPSSPFTLVKATPTSVQLPPKPASPLALATATSSQRQLPLTLRPASPTAIVQVPAAASQQPRPVLRLPVPARCRSTGGPSRSLLPNSDEESTPLPPMLPATVAVPPNLPARKPQGSKAARPLPARLQQLDDQTTMPREVYNRMLQLGDQARGQLGYGQHRLMFTPAGVPTLHRVVTPVTVIQR
eukprot:gb/GFBE01021310.1/.p1 GENE.gb/GFBE01021310.1/~~gb/GFBE01021310.1/.p1  ORF type:complete len:214 (+),score=44.00 gb/GFBE01021310.1/:1-642(+)